MSLEPVGEVELPAHHRPGGFDHAAVHGRQGRVYAAHTANDAIDVIDCASNTYRGSITGLDSVAGALVCEAQDLVFTSNRGEKTVEIFPVDQEAALVKVKVGLRPNGLAYDPGRRLLLAANVGEPSRPGSFSLSMVDVGDRAMIADIPVPGRTRWTVFDGDRLVLRQHRRPASDRRRGGREPQSRGSYLRSLGRGPTWAGPGYRCSEAVLRM